MKKITLLIVCILAFMSGYAQTAIQYGFSATTGTYTELASPTVLGAATADSGAASLDDVNYRVTFPAGFTFSYIGAAQTDLNINTNGYVGFSSAIWTSTTNYTTLSSNTSGGTNAGVIAAFGADLNAYSGTTSSPGSLSWQVEGSGTDEVFVVQYKNFKTYENSATVDRLNNFQIRLYASTHSTKPNYIEIVYGNNVIGDSNTTGIDVGIRNAATGYAANVNNVMIDNQPGGTTCTWLNAVTSNNNTNGGYFSNLNTAITIPNGLTYTFFPQGATAPAIVRDFAATTFTTTTATLSWTAPANATQYNIQYRLPGSCTWTNWSGNPVTSTTVTITGLTPFTSYQARVQASNGTANANWSYIPNTAGNDSGYTVTGTFTTLATCIAPTALAASTVGTNNATVGWTAPSGAPSGGYDYYYSTTNTAPTAGTTPSGNVAGTSVGLTGLDVNTVYYIWVRSNCGGSDGISVWSSALSFSTTQLPGTLTYTDGFEGASSWSFVNGTQTNKWVIGAATNNGGTKSLYISNDSGVTNAYSTGTTSLTHAYRDIAIPAGTTDVKLNFDWKAGGESTYDFLRVWVVPASFTPTAGTAITSTNGVQIGGNFNLSTGYVTAEYGIAASPYAGQTVRLVFEWRNDGSGGTQPGVSIDNINLQVLSCATPTALTATSTPSGAVISWTAPTVAPSGGYDYYYSTATTAPVSATTPSGNVATGTTVTLTTLTPDTVYNVWIRSNCGGDNGLWSATPASFRAECAPSAPSPTFQTFADYTGAMPTPACWREATGTLAATPTTLTIGTSNWTNQNYNNATNANGVAAYIELYGNRNAWIISPAIDLGTGTADYQLEYTASVIPYSASTAVTDMGEKFVKTVISTDGGLTWTEANVLKTYSNTNIPAGGVSEIISLEGYTGVIKVGFYAFSSSTTQDLRFYIDNFRVQEVPLCAAPLTFTASATVTETSGQVSWAAPDTAPANGYQYYVSTSNTAPIATTTATGSLAAGVVTAAITGLLPSTTNYVWVRSNCGANAYSEWVGPVTIATLCDSPDILTTTPGSACGQGAVTLGATTSGGILNWYTAATGGTLVGTGTSFTSPVITTTTNYYVEAVNPSNVFVGPTYTGTSDNDLNLGSHGIMITTTKANTVINSVDIPFTGTGTFTISLKNTANTTVITSVTTASVTGLGTTSLTIPASLTIAAPGSYLLMITAVTGDINNLGYSTATYPYTTSDGSFSITNGYWYGSTSSNMYLYNLNVSAGCASARQTVVATITPATPIVATAGSAAICAGSGTALSVTSTDADYTYVWMPGNLTGATQTVSPAATTIYTVTATDAAANCVTTATVTVTVNPLPTPIVTATDVAACEGSIQPLTATGGNVTSAVFADNFNTLSSNFVTASVSGTADAALNTTYFSEGNGSVLFKTASTDADVSYSNNANINLSGYASAQLTFSHIVAMEGTTYSYDIGYVQYSTDGGTTWVTFPTSSYAGSGTLITTQGTGTAVSGVIFSNKSYADWNTQFTGTSSTPGDGPAASLWKTETINIPQSALSSSQFRVRFRYTTDVSANYFGWLIDNLKINGTKSQIVWSPVTNLFTDAAATVPYTGQVLSTVYTQPVAPITYTASAANILTGCAAAPVNVNVTISVTPAPVADAAQTFCNSATVANLVATGSSIQWYATATGGTPLTATTALTSGTTYYASQTINNCQGLTRTAVTVLINVTPAPTAAATQIFCNAATVANLVATETGIQWFAAATGGTALTPETALVNGTVYYASQTLNGCESPRTPVTAQVNVTAAPVANAAQLFCTAGTVANLTATGTAVQWYAAAAGGTALTADTALVNGTTYYASQTIEGCEGITRAAVTVTLTTIVADAPADVSACFSYTLPALTSGNYYTAVNGGGTMLTAGTVITETTLVYVYAQSGTVPNCTDENSFTITIGSVTADAPDDVTACNEYVLPALANGNYYTATGGTGTMLTAGTVISQTTDIYVFAQSTTPLSCTDEHMFTVTINTVAAPTGAANQTIAVADVTNATLADIVVVTEGTVTWYASEADALAGTPALPLTTVITAGTTYYATQTVGTCTSTAVLAVTIDGIVLGRDGFDVQSFKYYPNPVSSILNISYSSDITSVSIFNLLGQQVLVAQPNATDAKVDMSALSEGTYMVNVTAGSVVKTIKIVKKQ